MPHLLLLVAGIVVFFFLPAWLQVVLTLINVVIPDPLPFLDEIPLGVMTISKIALGLKRLGVIKTPLGNVTRTNGRLQFLSRFKRR